MRLHTNLGRTFLRIFRNYTIYSSDLNLGEGLCIFDSLGSLPYCRDITPRRAALLSLVFARADPGIFGYGRGGGGVLTLVQNGLLNILMENYLSPDPLPPIAVVGQLRKQRRPRVSQSVNAVRRWRGKCCFASRDERIIGWYQKK